MNMISRGPKETGTGGGLMMRTLRVAGIWMSCCLGVLFAPGQKSSEAAAIYQAFNEPFTAVEQKLDKLKSLGYTYVQVSPPFKSAATDIWWGRYQPIDLFKIEGPLGHEGQLKSLIAAAHRRGLKVLVDVVLNHVADPSYNSQSLDYPQFNRDDFHDPDGRRCISDYRDRNQVTQWWLCDLSLDHHLPDMKTQSTKVRNVHKQVLRWLLSMGVDGFRVDAMKHIEPDYFYDLVTAVPNDKLIYGEVIGETLDESNLYTPTMRVTDFHLLRVMLSAFSFSGDLRYLTDPESYGGALPGDKAVVFARNHDTAMHAGFFNFGDYQDALLANAWVLSRGVGLPSVYRDDYDKGVTIGALRFHNAMSGKSAFVRNVADVCGNACDPRTLLVMERGDAGVMILNTSNFWVDTPSARMPGLNAGCYRELQSGFRIQVSVGGDGQKWISSWGSPQRGGMQIGPRSALFLVQCNRFVDAVPSLAD